MRISDWISDVCSSDLLLAGVTTNDLSTLVETGAVGFGGRAVELTALVDDLTTVSGMLADQTTNIVSIIDGLDQASAKLAGGAERIDQLMVNLPRTTELPADHRELHLQTPRHLTPPAQTTNPPHKEEHRARKEGGRTDKKK